MLAAAREIKIGGAFVSKTPLLVPSFSSKGFPEVAKIIETLSGTITGSTLISAYDVANNYVPTPPTFPSFFILDSGGYESSKDTELSDTRANNYAEHPWTVDQLQAVWDKWNPQQPTIAVSYDHPKHRDSLANQIARAKELFQGRPFGREILLKPITTDAVRIPHKEIVASIHDLRDFDVIGFTEKELGFSLYDRMKKIAEVRNALTSIGLKTPIHIFGSLDTISTPLYFLAGADIFDGLTWLRYAYVDDQAVYGRNASALNHGIHMNDQGIDARIWADNYQRIEDLQLKMKRFLKEKDYNVFGARLGQFFDESIKSLAAEL